MTQTPKEKKECAYCESKRKEVPFNYIITCNNPSCPNCHSPEQNRCDKGHDWNEPQYGTMKCKNCDIWISTRAFPPFLPKQEAPEAKRWEKDKLIADAFDKHELDVYSGASPNQELIERFKKLFVGGTGVLTDTSFPNSTGIIDFLLQSLHEAEERWKEAHRHEDVGCWSCQIDVARQEGAKAERERMGRKLEQLRSLFLSDTPLSIGSPLNTYNHGWDDALDYIEEDISLQEVETKETKE